MSVVIAGAVAVTASCGVVKLHDALTGRPVQASVTVPAKPFVGATLIVIVEDAPMATVVTWVEALRLNVGVAVPVVELVITPNSPCVSPLVPAVK